MSYNNDRRSILKILFNSPIILPVKGLVTGEETQADLREHRLEPMEIFLAEIKEVLLISRSWAELDSFS